MVQIFWSTGMNELGREKVGERNLLHSQPSYIEMELE